MATSEKKEELKILVTGDVGGKFTEVFTRVRKVHEKNGPFHMLFCVGDFFPDEEKTADIKIPPAPIPTFILGPTSLKQLPYFANTTEGEIAENVTFLGQSGVYTGSSGLKVAYLSGLETKSGKTQEGIDFNHEDIRKIQLLIDNRDSSTKGIDLLLTSQWPADVEKFSLVKPESSPALPSPLVSQLAAILKPRYHFCGKEGINFERAPYRNHRVLAEPTQNITRFISLGKVGNPAKKKWLYAFNIIPAKNMDAVDSGAMSSEATEFPYRDVMDYNLVSNPAQSNSKPQQFFYSMDDGDQHQHGKRRHQNNNPNHRGGKKPYQQQERRPPINVGSCWFCLASPQVEKHLVVSVGDGVYLTLAKGGLTTDHVLILPIGHIESTVECSQEILEEIGKFKTALKNFFKSKGKGVVFYERNFRSPHLQIQAVPVPLSIVPGLKSICSEYAESMDITMEDIPSNAEISQLTRPGFPYFYIEFPDETKLFIQIHKGFPLQFGRELLASESVLNTPDKVDWQKCKVDKDEEAKLTADFRTAYKNFDFTL